MSPLKRPEYARTKLSDIPDEVIKDYNLHQLATPDGWVYVKVTRAMYGLPQAGSLGQDQLEKRLNRNDIFCVNFGQSLHQAHVQLEQRAGGVEGQAFLRLVRFPSRRPWFQIVFVWVCGSLYVERA